ncbi:MAG: DNA (cytosine-5-)-methyltransferase [Olsenella sp.]|nr:DNA (cytosine-5-)-methyltransferase [Olsenella sp.]
MRGSERERYPDVPNLGDITMIDWSDFLAEHGRPDLVVGGSPCQSFSIAGTRTGLAGASGLMYEYIRAVQELRPRWLIWENVPGALSVERGVAFGQLLSSLDDCGYSLAWRVLDAQFARVPLYDDSGELVGFVGPVAQRRRRVFLVGCLGTECASEVLFERESMSGDHPSERDARKALAASVGRGPSCGGFKWHQGSKAGSIGFTEEMSPTVQADKQPAVLSFLPGASRTASSVVMSEEMTPTLRASGGGTNTPAVAIDCRNYVPIDECSGTLQAKANGGYSLNYQNPVAYALRMRSGKAGGGKGALVQDDLSGTIATGNDQTVFTMLTSNTGANGTNVNSEDLAYTLSRANEQAVAFANYDPETLEHAVVISDGSVWIVRRLTPVECERLMGFPDGWTDIGEWFDANGKRHKPADGPRYKALGNSFAVPVVRWIAERIEEVDIWL